MKIDNHEWLYIHSQKLGGWKLEFVETYKFINKYITESIVKIRKDKVKTETGTSQGGVLSTINLIIVINDILENTL